MDKCTLTLIQMLTTWSLQTWSLLRRMLVCCAGTKPNQRSSLKLVISVMPHFQLFRGVRSPTIEGIPILKRHLDCLNFISHVTCLKLQEEEPLIAYSFPWNRHLTWPIPHWQDGKVYPIICQNSNMSVNFISIQFYSNAFILQRWSHFLCWTSRGGATNSLPGVIHMGVSYSR